MRRLEPKRSCACAHTGFDLAPVGVEFDVEPDETVLNAAFRQGIALPHGCKEGQCSACKCILTDGEVDMLRYSTFALNDSEKDERPHSALPRARLLRPRGRASQLRRGAVVARDRRQDVPGTRDADRLASPTTSAASQIELKAPIKFWAGQYVDITVTTEAGKTITRSFSMANPPLETQKLEFIIKKYPQGKFSGELDSGGIACRRRVNVVGPYGACFDAKNGTDHDPGRRRLRHVAGLVDPQRSLDERRTAPGLLLLRRAHQGRSLLSRGDRGADGRASGGRVHPRAVARRRRPKLGRRARLRARARRRAAEGSSPSTARATSTPAGRRR